MWSWKSRGFSLFGFFLGIWLSPLAVSALAQETTPRLATLRLQVTLVGITSYQEFRELRAALSQVEGVEKVSLDSEAPGLITMIVRYAGEPRSLIEKISGFFPGRYSIREKRLPSGGTEVTISH